MHTLSKKTASQLHARKRMLQRYGIWLSKKLRRKIIAEIQAGKAKWLGRQSLRVTGWQVEVEGKSVQVLYDSKRHVLVTVLPEGAKWEYEDEPTTDHRLDASGSEPVSVEG